MRESNPYSTNTEVTFQAAMTQADANMENCDIMKPTVNGDRILHNKSRDLVIAFKSESCVFNEQANAITGMMMMVNVFQLLHITTSKNCC